MSTSPKKRKLKTLTISQKLEIIEMRENGASWVKIAQEKKINESTVRSIYAKKKKTQELKVRTQN